MSKDCNKNVYVNYEMSVYSIVLSIKANKPQPSKARSSGT